MWNFYEFPGNTEENPDVGPDNVAYTVRNLRTLFAVNPDGTERWRYFSDGGILFEPSVSPNNDLVFLGGRVTYGEPGLFLGVGTNGIPLFRVDLPDEPGFPPYGQVVPSSHPAFAADGRTAYAVADVLGDGTTGTYCFLYAIDTSTSAPPPATKPAAPSNLQATVVSATKITLNWTDNSTNESGFRVLRCKGGSCTSFARIATVGTNVTTYSNTGLAAASTYRYFVKAFNSAGASARSNIVTAKTP